MVDLSLSKLLDGGKIKVKKIKNKNNKSLISLKYNKRLKTKKKKLKKDKTPKIIIKKVEHKKIKSKKKVKKDKVKTLKQMKNKLKQKNINIQGNNSKLIKDIYNFIYDKNNICII
jgi:hypothetical protein